MFTFDIKSAGHWINGLVPSENKTLPEQIHADKGSCTSNFIPNRIQTRTNRTPAFWEYPRRPMITHTIDSYQTPNQKTKSMLQIWKNAKNYLDATRLLKLLNKMCKYEMDLASIVEVSYRADTILSTDARTDGRREISTPPFNFVEAGGITMDRIHEYHYNN